MPEEWLPTTEPGLSADSFLSAGARYQRGRGGPDRWRPRQPAYSPHAFEIPAFIWVNTAYEQAHPGRLEALRANSSKEVRSHDVFYTLADLMGISWPGASARRSVASSQFVPDTSMKHIAGGVLVDRPGGPAL